LVAEDKELHHRELETSTFLPEVLRGIILEYVSLIHISKCGFLTQKGVPRLEFFTEDGGTLRASLENLASLESLLHLFPNVKISFSLRTPGLTGWKASQYVLRMGVGHTLTAIVRRTLSLPFFASYQNLQWGARHCSWQELLDDLWLICSLLPVE
jgi:hypothetical protein